MCIYSGLLVFQSHGSIANKSVLIMLANKVTKHRYVKIKS